MNHCTCRELILEAVDAFNYALRRQRNEFAEEFPPPHYYLNADPHKLEAHYSLYLATKKKGKAKDDFPSK